MVIYTNIQVHIRKKGQQPVQNLLSCITSKIPEQNIYQAASDLGNTTGTSRASGHKKQYFCRKMYTQNNVFPFFFKLQSKLFQNMTAY